MKNNIEKWSKDKIKDLEAKYELVTKREREDYLLKARREKIDDDAYEIISKFKDDFYLRFGVVPSVIYKFNHSDYFPITLNELEEICNLFVVGKDYYTIKDRVRKRHVVMIRQIFYYLSVNMGYSLVSVGKYLNYDHATVIHAVKVVSNLIDINDLNTVKNLKLIHDEIEKRIKHNSTVYADLKGELIS